MSYNTLLDYGVYRDYVSLDMGSTVLAEYVWIDAKGTFRCKTKTLETECKTVEDYPIWNFDGSSTGQAPGHDSEVYLKPAAVFKDPWRRGAHVVVLCECVVPVGDTMKFKPQPEFNTRATALKIFDRCKEAKPWYGIEQEYTLFYDDCRTPFGWPNKGFPAPQGPYYCSAGAQNAYGRRVADAHYRACIYAGVKVAGINAEVMAGQWEYQIGPCEGIQSGDHVMMSRYVMYRVCEDYGVVVSFDPKPISGDWNGAGAHTNYSTLKMRSEGGYGEIIDAIKKLEAKHMKHIESYGKGNERRLTGLHETAKITEFTYGVADRGASVRIPRTTFLEKKGYLEDRRPASNMDPYIVTALIAQTTILGE